MPYIGNAPYQGLLAGTNIQDGTIDTVDLKDNSVTNSKLSGITTTYVSEGTGLYYTDARARGSLSFTSGSGAYNSTTGVITIPTNNNELTNGSGYLTGNQTVTLSGDASGSGSTAIAVTLANSGVVAGTYNNVTVNSKGLITSGSNTSYLTGNQTVTLSGDASGSGSTAITVTLANSGVVAGTYNNVTVNSKGLITNGSNTSYLTGNQTVTLSGDASGSGSTAITVTLANSGVVAGTYNNVTVNSKGLITSGSNTSYLTGNQTVTLSGDASGSGSTAITVTLATVSASKGGTGQTSLTANNVILGNGTSAVQFVAPGTNGNVLTSNGTTWVSAAVAASLLGVTDSASPFETSLGYQAGNVSTGVNNTFIGYQAGLVNSTSTDNTAVGFKALDANTTGSNNTALGSNALGANISGTDNVAVGTNALLVNTGTANVAVGKNALNANTSGEYNVGVGFNALRANVSGVYNSAFGSWALSNNTASLNTAFGYATLNTNTTGTNNTAVGYYTLYNNNGSDNTAVGYAALDANTSGNYNVAIGSNALGTSTTGSNNIGIGYGADASSTSVSNEVTIGNTSITSTRLRGMVQLNAAMFEQATVSATAATGTINFDVRTQSVLYYTSNAGPSNWTLNVRGNSGVSLDSIMSTGQSLTIAFLVTNGATAYYQSGFQVDSVLVTPKWQGGTAPTSGNANSVDIYAITIVKTGSATFTAFASQTKFA